MIITLMYLYVIIFFNTNLLDIISRTALAELKAKHNQMLALSFVGIGIISVIHPEWNIDAYGNVSACPDFSLKVTSVFHGGTTFELRLACLLMHWYCWVKKLDLSLTFQLIHLLPPVPVAARSLPHAYVPTVASQSPGIKTVTDISVSPVSCDTYPKPRTA